MGMLVTVMGNQKAEIRRQKPEGRNQKPNQKESPTIRRFYSSGFCLLPSGFWFLPSAFCFPSPHLQQEPFQILPFRAVERDRVIRAGFEAAHEGDPASCIDRGGEDDFLKEI